MKFDFIPLIFAKESSAPCAEPISVTVQPTAFNAGFTTFNAGYAKVNVANLIKP